MNVEEVQRGPARADRLRRLAGRAGRPQARRRDHRGQRPLAARASPPSRPTTRDQGPGRHRGHADRASRQGRARERHAQARAGRRPGRRVRDDASRTARRSPTCSSPSFTSGAHGEVARGGPQAARPGRQGRRARPARQRRRPAQRGGARSRRSSSPRARSSRPRAARGPSTSSRPRAARSTAKIPVVVLVNRESASASEIVTGALQDRNRAEVVGTRTFGKGVFQEIEQLSNGGALDITVGEYFTPSGRNLGGGGSSRARASRPTSRRRTTPRRKRDEALDVAVATSRTTARERRPAPPRRRRAAARAARSSPCSRSAAASSPPTPFFARGRRINVDRRAREARAGDLVLVAPTGPRGGHGEGRCAGSGGPTSRATCSRR